MAGRVPHGFLHALGPVRPSRLLHFQLHHRKFRPDHRDGDPFRPAGERQNDILANQHTAWLGIVFVASWVAIPGAIIIFLAGLVSIQPEVYEAASIDGASTWKQFQRMTFPLLFPFFVINTILTFKNFLNVYDICVGLTNGGPGTATTSVAQTIFSGFFTGDYAYQMANAVIFFLITLFFAVFQLGVIRRRGASL
jgi:raffinose/stachyose/melibiose transport system permease protein